MLGLIENIGRTVIEWLAGMGRMMTRLLTALFWVFVPPLRLRRVVRQIHFMGWRSLLVVVLTGAFTGMVLGLQGYYTLRKFGATAMLGPAVALSLIREIGPVLCALVVTGRAGSAMAAVRVSASRTATSTSTRLPRSCGIRSRPDNSSRPARPIQW